jgi:hypothetical protein
VGGAVEGFASMSIAAHRRRVNRAAVVVAFITTAMALVYVLIMRSQGNSPLLWVLAVLAIAAGLASYGANVRARLAPVSLAISGMLLIVMGVLGIFSIGLPLLVAGVIATVSGWVRAADR